MTLTATINKVQYTGDGATVSFPVTFKFWDADDLKLILTDAAGVETTWTRGTQYTVTGGSGATGNITVDTAPTDYTPATGETLLIKSNLSNLQPLVLPIAGGLDTAALTQQLDITIRLLQQRSEELDRAVLLTENSQITGVTVPDPVAGKTLRWDVGATKLENVTPTTGGSLTLPLPIVDGGTASATAKAAKAALGADIDVVNVFDHGADGVGTETTEVQAAITAGVAAGKPILLPEPTYTTGALTTAGAMLRSRKMYFSDARGLGETLARTNLAAAAALTHTGEDFVFTYRNSKVSGNDIYAPIFPSINHYDVVQGVCDIVNGGTIEHATGLAGYIKNLDATVNGVALFGCGYVDVNSGAIWGINTLLSDDAVRAAGTDTGRRLTNEFDFNVMHPNTQVIGLSVGGNSLAQPTVANGFIVNILGTGIKWTTGFFSQDGAANNGLALGMQSTSGANIESQKLLLSSSDGASVKQTFTLRAQTGAFLVLSGTTLSGFKVSSGDILLDTGKSFIVNGLAVLSDRKAGWTSPTGTATRTGFVTSTVTTAVLAEHVKALIDDLTAHGMIGA